MAKPKDPKPGRTKKSPDTQPEADAVYLDVRSPKKCKLGAPYSAHAWEAAALYGDMIKAECLTCGTTFQIRTDTTPANFPDTAAKLLAYLRGEVTHKTEG